MLFGKIMFLVLCNIFILWQGSESCRKHFEITSPATLLVIHLLSHIREIMHSLALWCRWSALPAMIWKHFWDESHVDCCRLGGGRPPAAAAGAAGMEASPFVWLKHISSFSWQQCILQPRPSESIWECVKMPRELFLVEQYIFIFNVRTDWAQFSLYLRWYSGL